MPRRDASRFGRSLIVLAAIGLGTSAAEAGTLYNVAYLGADYPTGINNQGEVGLAGSPTSVLGGLGDVREYHPYPRPWTVYESLGPKAGTATRADSAGPIPGPGRGSVTHWINDSGDFAKWDATGAYVSVGGVRTDIPAPFANYYNDPRSINNSGQVVGVGFVNDAGDYKVHAWEFTGGVKQDLGALGGRTSGAEAINDAGTVVGWSQTPASDPKFDGPVHAFKYDGTMHDLAPVLGNGPSHAFGINGKGDIVGDVVSDYSNSEYAFLLKDGKVTDLNSFLPKGSPWYLTSALAINDLGQITAIGIYRVGSTPFPAAFLLTPADLGNPASLPVPEPSTLALFGFAALALGVRRWRGSQH